MSSSIGIFKLKSLTRAIMTAITPVINW